MPAFIKTKEDEADWQEARRIVDKQYPDKSPDGDDDSYWKLTNSVYQNIKKGRKMKKVAFVGDVLAQQIRLRKCADSVLNKLTPEQRTQALQGVSDQQQQYGAPNLQSAITNHARQKTVDSLVRDPSQPTAEQQLGNQQQQQPQPLQPSMQPTMPM